jgi:hypothetical protein
LGGRGVDGIKRYSLSNSYPHIAYAGDT